LSDEPATVRSEGTVARLPDGERRRPGRIENVSPELIPLLCGQVSPLTDEDDREPHDLTAATGIAAGLLICGALWVLVLGMIVA
jgi:hypothetical protein